MLECKPIDGIPETYNIAGKSCRFESVVPSSVGRRLGGSSLGVFCVDWPGPSAVYGGATSLVKVEEVLE